MRSRLPIPSLLLSGDVPMRSPRPLLGLLCGVACVTAVAVYAGGPNNPPSPGTCTCTLPAEPNGPINCTCSPAEAKVVPASHAAPAKTANVSSGEARHSIVAELTATLEETRSVDTYLLAVTALAEMGPR